MAHQRELVRLQRRFVADVSHELRALAAIRLLGETARRPSLTRSVCRLTTEPSRSRALGIVGQYPRLQPYRTGVASTCLNCKDFAAARQAWALFEPQFAAAGFSITWKSS